MCKDCLEHEPKESICPNAVCVRPLLDDLMDCLDEEDYLNEHTVDVIERINLFYAAREIKGEK